METKVEKENKTTKEEFILTNPDWLDLPEPITTNIILEHLEIVDYIRFSAVCKKWYSIQNDHRIRCYPCSPPLQLTFPWLSCKHCVFEKVGDRSFLFYLPDKKKPYNIPLLRTCKKVHRIYYGLGCLLLLFERDVFNPPAVHIFNPISGAEIKLPPCSLSKQTFRTAHISSPLTDPNCTLLVEGFDREIYLYGLNNNCCWRKVGDYPLMYMNATAFCKNKIFRMFFWYDRSQMLIIDPLVADPVAQMIEMDYSEIRAVLLHDHWSADLVDFFGELVMIVIVNHYCWSTDYIEEFHVYRADFCTNKWVKMETLGDGVLFYSSSNTFALRAADVGCKKNAIYSADDLMNPRVAWMAFDLGTRDWIDGPPLSLSNRKYHLSGKESCRVLSWSWFLPTPNYFSGAKTNRNCQNI